MRRFLLEQCGTELLPFMPSRQTILRNRAMRLRGYNTVPVKQPDYIELADPPEGVARMVSPTVKF